MTAGAGERCQAERKKKRKEKASITERLISVIDELETFTFRLGALDDEKAVLAWFTDQGNLELADQIEEVNEKMLKKIVGTSAHVVAFFCNSTR